MGNRERLLAAASKLLEDKGYSGITARDLVAASGTNLASIGYHFGSKDGLLSAALGDAFTGWFDRLTALAFENDDPSPFSRLMVGLSSYTDTMAERRKLSLAYLDATARASRDAELRQLAAGQYQRLRELIAEWARVLIGDDVQPEDPRFMGLASVILAIVDGLAVQWMLDPANAPTGEQVVAGFRAVLSAAQTSGDIAK